MGSLYLNNCVVFYWIIITVSNDITECIHISLYIIIFIHINYFLKFVCSWLKRSLTSKLGLLVLTAQHLGWPISWTLTATAPLLNLNERPAPSTGQPLAWIFYSRIPTCRSIRIRWVVSRTSSLWNPDVSLESWTYIRYKYNSLQGATHFLQEHPVSPKNDSPSVVKLEDIIFFSSFFSKFSVFFEIPMNTFIN